MFIKTFQGYNCYSSAIGEAAAGQNGLQIKEVILSQWTYYFDKEQLYAGEWYTGAAAGPVDLWLKRDLHKYLGLKIQRHTSNGDDAIKKSSEVLKEQGAQIVLLDFYYINSFNWESLKRFNIERQHDPHFVILTKIYREEVEIIDPFYHHKETLALDAFIEARGSLTKQGQLKYDYFTFECEENKATDIRTLLFERFERYLRNEMHMRIEEFASEINILHGTKEDRSWAFTAYNCLNQIVYQHKNLLILQQLHDLDIPDNLNELWEFWSVIRKYLFEYYSFKDLDLNIITNALYQVAEKERKFAQEMYSSL